MVELRKYGLTTYIWLKLRKYDGCTMYKWLTYMYMVKRRKYGLTT